MAFSATKFIYDGEPCETYGLMLYTFDSKGGVIEGDLGANIEMIEDRTLRNVTPTVFGSKQGDPLKFKLTFGSLTPISREDFSEIAYWLCGKSEYRVLEILQDDMAETLYKCYMTNIQHENIRGIPYAFTTDVICDCPYAYSYPETYSFTVSGSKKTVIYNDSAYSGYLFPHITLTPSNVTQTVSIINEDDNNREFKFTQLNNYDNEIIYIDNARQIITSNNGVNMYPYFNKNFFRLIRGLNNITITGDCVIRIVFQKYKAAGS